MTALTNTLPEKVNCPRCRSEDHVTRKVHALPPGLDWIDPEKGLTPAGAFVNGYWCARCEVGFIPDELRKIFGLVPVRRI